MRTLLLILGLLVAAMPVAAQDHQHDPNSAAEGDGALADGWNARLDRADASMSNVRYVAMGDGFHATLGPAAIFYRPDDTASGSYRAHATFTQTRASEHPEAYGLFVGGQNLDGESQDYLYFLIRQDGQFLVKHRAGEETHTLIDWTEHPAIAIVGEEGGATNELAIDVTEEGASFSVNGTEVGQLERVPYMSTDGIAGLRINHNLDVHIAEFGIEPAEAP